MYAMLKQVIIVLTFLCAYAASIFAQTPVIKGPYGKEWMLVDSLIEGGFPKSADSIIRKILVKAAAANDGPDIIKARLCLMAVREDKDREVASIDNIKKGESYIVSASGIEKAIWESLTAQSYWDYFRENSEKLFDRTPLSEMHSDDMAAWDGNAFLKRINELYLASLRNKALLLKTPVEQYLSIIIEGENTRKLRPAMYDLLAFRAIDFFGKDDHDVMQPAYKFEMGSPTWFEDAKTFIHIPITEPEMASLEVKALQCYQDIIAVHLDDANPDALIDADLHRLDFVYSNSVAEEKDSLYIAALRHIEKKYDGNPIVAEVSYQIIQQLLEIHKTDKNKEQWLYGNKDAIRTIPLAVSKLKEIIARYPGSEGAVHAANDIIRFQQAKIEIKTEEVNIPNRNIKALITYQNTDKVYLKLYRVANVIEPNTYIDQDTLLKQLQTLQPVRTWTQALPGSEDMLEHNAEIKMESLPFGRYYVVASATPDMKNKVSLNDFQVSSLSFIREDDGDGNYVLNRETGYPVRAYELKFGKRFMIKTRINNCILQMNINLMKMARCLYYSRKEMQMAIMVVFKLYSFPVKILYYRTAI
jgi:hypothetical protein